ncbi:MAG: diguanylate cyclase [Armatimonadota bacterium]|nr:diguanylate cyclase [Armatimonadota bacterium]
MKSSGVDRVPSLTAVLWGHIVIVVLTALLATHTAQPWHVAGPLGIAVVLGAGLHFDRPVALLVALAVVLVVGTSLVVPWRVAQEAWRGLGALWLAMLAAATWISQATARTRAQIQERLEHASQSLAALSAIDPTTGLYTSSRMRLSLVEEVARAQRYGRPLTLVAMQIDNLREIEAAHGPKAAAEAVTQIARQMLSQVRRFDHLAEDEPGRFLLLLPETDAARAAVALRRLLSSSSRPPILAPNGQEVRFTLSGAVVSYPQDGESAEALLEAVKATLRRAELSGRGLMLTSTDARALE